MNDHHRKELDLLQKLYGLYDAVMSKIGGYYKTLWTAVDTDVINTELLDFQNRYIKYLYTVDCVLMLIKNNQECNVKIFNSMILFCILKIVKKCCLDIFHIYFIDAC